MNYDNDGDLFINKKELVVMMSETIKQHGSVSISLESVELAAEDVMKVLDTDKNFDYHLPEGYDAYVFDYDGPIPSKEFYEPFGQITYWERQEIDLEIEAPGTYYMAVFDKNGSSGKLAVAIGYVEDFSGDDFVTVLPNAWLESRYFSEDFTPLVIFIGIISGIFLLIGFLIYRKIKQ